MADDIYGNLAGALAYHAERGNAGWSADSVTDPDRSAALIRAAEFIDQSFKTRFPGYKVGQRDQIREWPRYSAGDIDGNAIAFDEIPREVERATYEAALRELAEPGSLRPDYTGSGLVKSQRVEDAVSREFFAPTETGYRATATLVPILADILAPILTGGTPRSGLVGRFVRG